MKKTMTKGSRTSWTRFVEVCASLLLSSPGRSDSVNRWFNIVARFSVALVLCWLNAKLNELNWANMHWKHLNTGQPTVIFFLKSTMPKITAWFFCLNRLLLPKSGKLSTVKLLKWTHHTPSALKSYGTFTARWAWSTSPKMRDWTYCWPSNTLWRSMTANWHKR